VGEFDMRGFGVIIVILIGVILGFRGLYRLFIMKKYTLLVLCILFWFGYPLGVNASFTNLDMFNSRERMWIALPVVISVPFWLIFGFVINKKVENLMNGTNYRDSKTQLRRIIGFVITLISAIVWILGFQGTFKLLASENYEVIIAFFPTFSFFIGLLYLIKGKPFDKWDD
jgi:hypothetical protein